MGRTSALIAAGRVLATVALPGPPARPEEALDWLERHGATVAVLSSLRLGAFVAIAYLLVLGFLTTGSRLGGMPRLRILLHHLPARMSRLLVAHAPAAGVAAGLAGALLPTPASADPVSPGDTPTTQAPDDATEEPALMVPLTPENRTSGLPAGPTTTSAPEPRGLDDPLQPASRAARDDDPTPATMHSLDADPSSTAPPSDDRPPDEDGARDDPPGDPSPDDPSPDDTPTAPTTDDTWRVELGDHLWGIASEIVDERAEVTDETAVFDYWQRLIATNHDRLIDPDNPDLLFPGQVLALPPLAAG